MGASLFMLYTDFPDGRGWTHRGRFQTLSKAREYAIAMLSELDCNEAHITDSAEGTVVMDLYSHRDADGLHITSEEMVERIVH